MFLKKLLFKLNAEIAHKVSLSCLQYVPTFLIKKANYHKMQVVSAMGLQFPHALGIAAGLDKNGEYLTALAKLGYAFIEVGTVTPKAQLGNKKPRLFRLPAAEAIINRMGFNNFGIDALITNIKSSNYDGILGINIGKNAATPLNFAVNDYIYCLEKAYPYASYITINISSPNTQDLRQLQQQEYFTELVLQLTVRQLYLADKYKTYVPLVIKISPDESEETLKNMANIAIKHKIAGIIATNTTCSRSPAIQNLTHGQEVGGLSGEPLQDRALFCMRLLKQEVGDSLTLIGVGGINDALSAQTRLEAGAKLLQVYTGLVYHGFHLLSDIYQS